MSNYIRHPAVNVITCPCCNFCLSYMNNILHLSLLFLDIILYSLIPGPHSRNDPLTIGSDTILWFWSADRIPQTTITINSWDWENMKSNSLLPNETWYKSFTGKFRTEIMWLRLNEKCQTDDIYSWRHNRRCGNAIYVCRYIQFSARILCCSRYNLVWTCHVWQVCVCG